MNNITKVHEMIVPTNEPKKRIVANGVVCRWGYRAFAPGFSKCAEQLFLRMPKKEDLRAIIEAYNAANGIDDPFNPADYGYAQTE